MRAVSADGATSTVRDSAVGSATVQFIHVGLPKAASTWLQDELFDGHPELAVLGGRSDGDLYRRFVREARRLVHASDLSCDAAAFAANVEQLCRGHREARSRDGRAPKVAGMSY